MLIQLPILYALYYIFQNAYVYVDVIGNNYTDIANAIIQIPAALRMEAFTPYAQDLVDTYKNLGTLDLSNVNDVVYAGSQHQSRRLEQHPKCSGRQR